MTRPKQLECRKGLLVKLLSKEREYIEEQARIGGLTVSEYIRRCALNKKIHSRVNVQIIGHVSRLGGLQKHLLMQIRSHPYEAALRDQLNGVLAEVHSALRQLKNGVGE